MNKQEQWSLLVAVISRLNKEAGSYLSNLPKANWKRRGKLRFTKEDLLIHSFSFEETSQGFDYWFNLNKESTPFIKLCHKLYSLDKEAYLHLKELIINHYDVGFSKHTISIQSVFVWSSTPQGIDYWSRINQLLNSNK
jgi:hypothetical protein